MTNPALTNGPKSDGSNSLAKESKVGVATSAILFFGLQSLAQGLSGLDTSSWSGWWVPAATGVISAAGGLLAAYFKKNR